MEGKLILKALATGNTTQQQQAAAMLKQPLGLKSLGLVGSVTGGIVFVDGSGQVLGARITTQTQNVSITAEQFSTYFSNDSNENWVKFQVPPGTTDRQSDPIE